MIQARPASPSNEVTRVSGELAVIQSSFAGLGAYPAQVRGARGFWKETLLSNAALFASVRTLLKSMDPSRLGACMYCGRSEASEIDHFRSMSWFPGHLFDWLNYIYGCSACNRKKGSKLRIHNASGQEVKYARKRGAIAAPAPAGSPLLINPRSEDPMSLLKLDLSTGLLLEIDAKGSLGQRRATHTINHLGLNKRNLPEERVAMYRSAYLSSLRVYVGSKQAGANPSALNLTSLSHRLIWEEMKRQYQVNVDLIPLFTAAPEARFW